ncbi:hypothetical protein SHIRM173S_01007 [Streptomyces hirsutus]
MSDFSSAVIAVVGGTGPQGKGLAYRLARAGHPRGAVGLRGRAVGRRGCAAPGCRAAGYRPRRRRGTRAPR